MLAGWRSDRHWQRWSEHLRWLFRGSWTGTAVLMSKMLVQDEFVSTLKHERRGMVEGVRGVLMFAPVMV